MIARPYLRVGYVTVKEVWKIAKNKVATKGHQSCKLYLLSFIGNGEVDFQEFLTLMKKQMRKIDPEDELKELFQVFDMNSDGKIR